MLFTMLKIKQDVEKCIDKKIVLCLVDTRHRYDYNLKPKLAYGQRKPVKDRKLMDNMRKPDLW